MPLLRRTPRSLRIRELLVRKRLEVGLTQQELAAKMCRLQSYISNVESGERRLTLEDFLDFAEILKIEEADFIEEVRMTPNSRQLKKE